MTVLVTGGAGFLGSHVTDLLVAQQQPVRVLVAPGEDAHVGRADDVDLVVADLGDRSAIEASLSGVERVIHCAARTGPWGPAADYERVNVRALEMLIRSAKAAGVRRLVHVSSITVHGNDVRGRADESTPFKIEPNPYSQSKVAGERLIERMVQEEGAPVTIVRPGWIYGPRDIASFSRLAQMIAAKRMVLIGNGSNRIPLIYVEDVARGALLASEANVPIGSAYLLVNDEEVTQREFLSSIAVQLGTAAPKRHVPYRLATSLGSTIEVIWRATRRAGSPPVMRYGTQLFGGENQFDISKARADLGFAPRVAMLEGVRRSVAWLRSTETPLPVEAAGRQG